MRVRRFETNPIICPDMDDRMGSNINGPSLIRVPSWVGNPLGKYYLYFAHHEGTYIRMAFADRLEGPWQVYGPGVLDLADSFASSHIASPDVHVLEDRREIRMYYHGCCIPEPPHQVTRLSISSDGLQFRASPDILGSSYWRAFRWQDYWYTLEMPGTFRRSRDGMSDFKEGPTLFPNNMRHSAVLCNEDILWIFYSNAYDCPERIMWTSIHMNSDWHSWSISPPKTLLAPETEWEGANCPLEASERGSIQKRVRQLRDPCVFQDKGKTYLLYSVGGEYGIAIGELIGRIQATANSRG